MSGSYLIDFSIISCAKILLLGTIYHHRHLWHTNCNLFNWLHYAALGKDDRSCTPVDTQ